MIEWRIGWVVAILQLLTALSLFGVLWAPWNWLVLPQPMTTAGRLTMIASLLFISLPIIAVTKLWRRKISAFYAMAAFPIMAFVFGTVPIPYASVFYSSDISLNSWVIGIVDALAVIFAIILLLSCRRRSIKPPY